MADTQRYCFHIHTHSDEDTSPRVIPCIPERIKEIEEHSVVLKQRIKKPGNPEVIPLETDDNADVNSDTLSYIVENPPFRPETNSATIKLHDLSRHCSALWKYQWIPESASSLWARLERAELEPQIQCVTNSKRCWQQRTSKESQRRALFLINIAIVFGLDGGLRATMDGELREQIQTAVWNSTPDVDARLNTSVEFLHEIEDMRREELEAVFTWFYVQLVHLSKKHPKNVQQVREKLKTEMRVDFYEEWTKNTENGEHLTKYSVYEFVRKIEDILNPSRERRATESATYMPKVVGEAHKQKEDPTVDWPGVTVELTRGTVSVVKKAFSRMSGSHELKWGSELDKMFDDAHDKIQERQNMRADTLIGLRNAKLETWEKALKDENETL